MKQHQTCVGIDLARRAKHKAVLVSQGDSPESVPKRAFSFSHDRAGFHALCEYVCRRGGTDGLDGVTVNIEPTSGVWEPLAAFLNAQGAKVYFTRPDIVAAQRKVHSRHAKTDRIDARTLAALPSSLPERLIRTVKVEPRLRKLRELSNQRQRLVEEVTRWKNRFVAKIEPVWVPLLARLKEEHRFCKLVRAFFQRFVDPRSVVRFGRKRFFQWCAKAAHANTAPDLFEALWDGAVQSAALWTEIERGGWMSVEWDTLGDLLKQDLRLIATMEKELKDIDERIVQARRDVPECDLLEQMPGVGKVVAVTLAGLLLPAERFANAKKCGAYTGYTSRTKASAGKEIQGLKITKTGNRRLKRDLALAAEPAMKNDPQLAAFAIRMLGKGKHYNKVRVAVGRKIAVRAYSLLKRFESGDTNVCYEWRDLQDNPVSKKEAKDTADRLWAEYDAVKK